jgi:FkbM family methyltransferase
VIHQADADEQRSIGVVSLGAGLALLRSNGFAPNLVIDVGVNRGTWTLETHRVFPSAKFILVDADPTNADCLARLCESLPNCRHMIALLGSDKRRSVRFFQMGTGSSVLSELTSAKRKEVALPMTTLDSVVGSEVEGPILLKLDVQGYELEVLRGGEKVLRNSEVAIIECSLIQYNDGAPLFADVVDFMKDHGFVVYDFCGESRREVDGALFQTDVMFTSERSVLRKPFTV